MLIERAANELKKQGAKYLYLSSFDEHLSEYVPQNDSLRILISGFTGSVAESILTSEGKLILFVDGRYHEQADKECPGEEVDVVKVPYKESLEEALFNWLGEHKVQELYYISERTPWTLKSKFEESMSTFSLDSDAFFQAIGFQTPSFTGKIQHVPLELTGESTLNKCARLIPAQEAAFISGLDTLAWFSNCRSFTIPYQSTFRGVALACNDQLHLFCEHKAEVDIEGVRFHSPDEWSQVTSQLEIKKIHIDRTYTSVRHYDSLAESFPGVIIQPDEKSFAYEWHALKNEAELRVFEESFEHSDRAIFNSIKWITDKILKEQKVSELEFRDTVEAFYKDEGALSQSFSTISGFGANSSIIHYSKPSEQRYYEVGENILLDSGAFYSGGLATDCTRTHIVGIPTPKQKKLYTLVLKSLLGLMDLSVPKGTTGKQIDDIARAPIAAAGYHYAHGTGHGIGVNVHEAGYAITPMAEQEIRVGTVGSIEPGIYVEGLGGVRLENVVTVIEDPDNHHNIRFKNLIFIGFCPELIDESELTAQEKKTWLSYEEQCRLKGRSFMTEKS